LKTEESIEIILNSDEWKKLPFFLEVSDTAAFLNLSPKTIIREIQDKNLSAMIKKGRKRKRYLILKTALADYIKRGII